MARTNPEPPRRETPFLVLAACVWCFALFTAGGQTGPTPPGAPTCAADCLKPLGYQEVRLSRPTVHGHNDKLAARRHRISVTVNLEGGAQHWLIDSGASVTVANRRWFRGADELESPGASPARGPSHLVRRQADFGLGGARFTAEPVMVGELDEGGEPL